MSLVAESYRSSDEQQKQERRRQAISQRQKGPHEDTLHQIAFCHQAHAPVGSRREATLKQLRAFEAQLPSLLHLGGLMVFFEREQQRGEGQEKGGGQRQRPQRQGDARGAPIVNPLQGRVVREQGLEMAHH